jgi:hypothetical protein
MNLRREATKTIWKTVVFAGAMLGSAACSKSKPAATTPAPAATVEPTATDPAANPCAANATVTPDPDVANPCGDDPCGDPCGDRIRGSSDEGDVGRGFILS